MTQKSNRKYRVLAVDDDPAILDLYQQILNTKTQKGRSDSAFEVDCCAQAKEAVEAVKFSLDFNRSYAVVFLDLNLPPGPDGEWAAEQIQKLDPLTDLSEQARESWQKNQPAPIRCFTCKSRFTGRRSCNSPPR